MSPKWKNLCTENQVSLPFLHLVVSPVMANLCTAAYMGIMDFFENVINRLQCTVSVRAFLKVCRGTESSVAIDLDKLRATFFGA